MSNWTEPREDESRDVLFDKRVQIIQSRKGYRTSVDAMLLAWFALEQSESIKRVADVGAGSGLISILIGLRSRACDLTLFEKQPQLAWRARRNLRLNGVVGRVVPCELANPVPQIGPFDLVVSNPPFYRSGSGVLPPNTERRTAHYEGTAPLERFVRVCSQLAGSHGQVCVIYPADETERLIYALDDAELGHIRVMMVHHRHLEQRPTRVMIAARRGPLDVVTLPPLRLHPIGVPDHTYTEPLSRFITALGPSKSIA